MNSFQHYQLVRISEEIRIVSDMYKPLKDTCRALTKDFREALSRTDQEDESQVRNLIDDYHGRIDRLYLESKRFA